MPDFKNLAGEYNLKFTTSLDLECDYYIVKNFIYYTEDALRKDAEDVVRFAETEGLTAHANSIKVRFDMK